MIQDENILFCTIVTESHIPYALALFNSISKHYSNPSFALLVCGCSREHIDELDSFSEKIEVYTESSFNRNPNALKIIKKYKDSPDHLRWSLKASLLLILLQGECKKAIYFDSDIYVVGGLRPLINQLDECRCLITPHWRSIDPEIDKNNFEFGFQHGLYNAGFFGVSIDAIDILKWWEAVCLFNCSKLVRKGYYVDQRYLDVIPIYFEGVTTVLHRGCNIAFWNLSTNIRIVKDGKLKILNKWDPIFIHFSPLTIKNILSKKDPELHPFYEQWIACLNDAYDSIGFTRQYAKSNTLKNLTNRARRKIARGLYNLGDIFIGNT